MNERASRMLQNLHVHTVQCAAVHMIQCVHTFCLFFFFYI